MTSVSIPRPPTFVRLAVAADEGEARRWLDALTAAGIEAEARIEDAARLVAASSVFPTGPAFATALYVPSSQRGEAAALLIDLGWQGRLKPHARPAVGARAALLGAVATALVGLGMAVVLAMRAS